MSDMNHMDDLFRESFRDYRPEVPPHIWENIAARKKRRRAIAWKPITLLLLILAGSLGGWWMMNREQGMVNREQGISNKEMHSRQPSTNNRQPEDGRWQMADGRKTETGKDEQITTNGEQGISNKEIPFRQPSTNNRQPEDGRWLMADGRKTETGKDEQITTNGEQGISNKEMPSRQPSTNNPQPDKQGTVNREQGILNKMMSSRQPEDGRWQLADGRKVNTKNNLSSRQPSTPNDRTTFNIQHSTSNIQRSSRQPSTTNHQPRESSTPNDNDSFNIQHSTFNIPGSSRLLTLEKIALNTTPGSRPIRPIRIPDCPPADNDRPAAQDYWEVYAGPDYAMKQYNSNDPALVEKRKETQSIQWAYSAGARYTRVFGNGISVRAGFNYTQINEKFSYLQDNVVQLIYIISPADDTTDSYYVRGTRYKNTVNRYRSIDLPVTLGYELGNGRLRANINAGVIINLRSWQSGSTIDQNLLPVNLNAANTVYQYRTNAGLAFTGAVSLYYRLTDRMHLLAEPYYRHNLSPISKEAGPVQERFRIMGLRLGLRMDIP